MIMAIAMVAMLAFGGTYAYFTAASKDITGTTTLGTVAISAGESAAFTSLVETSLPGQTVINEDVTFTNGSDVETWVFVKVATTDADNILSTTLANSGWKEVDTGIYGKEDKVAANTNVTFKVVAAISADLQEHNAEEDSTALTYMGKTATVTVTAAAVQGEGFTTVDDAYAKINWADTDSHSAPQA